MNTRFRSKTRVIANPWQDAWLFESEQAHQLSVSDPSIVAPLTALIEPPLIYPAHVIEELVHAGRIATHCVIVLITTKLGIQQVDLFSHVAMTVLPAPLSYRFIELRNFFRAVRRLSHGWPLQFTPDQYASVLLAPSE